jgi:hypothetical protein
MNADHVISPTLFQWDSQNARAKASKTGQRYIHHRETGTSVHLLVRESKTADRATPQEWLDWSARSQLPEVAGLSRWRGDVNGRQPR